ncbi:hypothetical protein HD806DRAFT_547512 [Xylariaceae sp. AK1471]|nr:hypothetical protein HD806DRAFT_547512 [Xylariaceae sp. AK1471]
MEGDWGILYKVTIGSLIRTTGQPIAFRLLTGLGGSAPLANGAKGFLGVDDHSSVFSVKVSTCAKEILADLGAKPTVFITYALGGEANLEYYGLEKWLEVLDLDDEGKYHPNLEDRGRLGDGEAIVPGRCNPDTPRTKAMFGDCHEGYRWSVNLGNAYRGLATFYTCGMPVYVRKQDDKFAEE